MNLTGQDVYQKGGRPSGKATKEQLERWDKLRALGCAVCQKRPEIHHCGTGGGGRKDHDKVIALCHFHHRGPQGIHTLGRRVWERKYGSEESYMAKAEALLIKIP